MFGMGFTEILMIAVVAILFLGPDRLPEAMVQIAKFINGFRKTVNEARSSFEEEIHLSQLKEEALGYKRTLEKGAADISGFKHALDDPARELQEALDVARSGMDRDLIDEGEAAPEASDSARGASEVLSYKERARKALETVGPKEETDTPRPSGFKNLDPKADA